VIDKVAYALAVLDSLVLPARPVSFVSFHSFAPHLYPLSLFPFYTNAFIFSISLHAVLCQLGQNIVTAAGSINSYFPCSGNGQCLTLREVSKYQDYITYFNSSTYSDWDADRIKGCVCDSGFQGVACAERSCPKGDNPLTNGTEGIQLIDCTCSSCTGGIRITFKGEQTELIPFYATADLIKYRFEVKS
jgi:hypothetical protein